jgi:predicted RNA binding protein YcfA (HicA-like mRNA interferase family)
MSSPKLPALRSERVVRSLVACGLTVVRQRGSHVILTKPGLQRPVVVPQHRRELPPHTVAEILRQADVTPEEFLEHV